MFAGIAASLAPYAMRIAAVIILILAIISGYFYWKHEVKVEQHKDDMAALAKRDAGEKEQSEKLMNEAITRVTQARQEDQDNTERVLKEYAKIISERSRPITVIGVRDNKATREKGDNCAPTGQTYLSERGAGSYGRISEEIPELAGLCLLAADEIRRTHVIK